MDVKKCLTCNIEKSIDDFYKCHTSRDGRFSKCKKCYCEQCKKRVKILKETSPEWVEKEKARQRECARKKIRKKVDTETRRRYTETHSSKYPEKYAARNAVQNMRGKKGQQFHHWSYNQEHWKDVIELSTEDHYKLHRFVRYDKFAMMYRTMDGTLLNTREKHVEYLEKVRLL